MCNTRPVCVCVCVCVCNTYKHTQTHIHNKQRLMDRTQTKHRQNTDRTQTEHRHYPTHKHARVYAHTYTCTHIHVPLTTNFCFLTYIFFLHALQRRRVRAYRSQKKRGVRATQGTCPGKKNIEYRLSLHILEQVLPEIQWCEKKNECPTFWSLCTYIYVYLYIQKSSNVSARFRVWGLGTETSLPRVGFRIEV